MYSVYGGLEGLSSLVGFAESGGWELNSEMRWFGGLASRVWIAIGKGVNIGKSVTNERGFAIQQREGRKKIQSRRREEREKERKEREVDMLIFFSKECKI